MRTLFLDRDGIINIDKGYVYKIKDFVWTDGIFEFLNAAISLDFQLFVVTNQSGIGRGYYTENDFHILTQFMLGILKQNGICIRHVFYSPYHPDAEIEAYRIDHETRKPNPGMFYAARDRYGIDFSNAVMVGDRESDAIAAYSAKISHIAIVNSNLKLNKNSALNFFNVSYFSDLKLCQKWLQSISR